MPPVRPQKKKKKRLQLRLYIAGNAPNSVHAIASIRMICEEHLPSGYNLEIVDMLGDPRRALADGIIVTPTLLKLLPLPVLRIIGGLGDTQQVLRILEGK
jgi:circadian clock protein KaiB